MLNAKQKRQVYSVMREYTARLMPVISKWDNASKYMPLQPETECMTYLAGVNSLALYDILHTPEDVYDLFSRILVFMNRDGLIKEVADQAVMNHYMDINKAVFKSLSNKFRRYEIYVNEVLDLFASKCFKAPTQWDSAAELEIKRNSAIVLDDARPIITEYIRNLAERVGKSPEKSVEDLADRNREDLSDIIIGNANLLFDTIAAYSGAERMFVCDPYTICIEFMYVMAGFVFQERCNDDPKMIQDMLADVFVNMPSEGSSADAETGGIAEEVEAEDIPDGDESEEQRSQQEYPGDTQEDDREYFEEFYPYMLDDLNSFMSENGVINSREVVKSIYAYALGDPDKVLKMINDGNKAFSHACNRAAAVVTGYVDMLGEYCDAMPERDAGKMW